MPSITNMVLLNYVALEVAHDTILVWHEKLCYHDTWYYFGFKTRWRLIYLNLTLPQKYTMPSLTLVVHGMSRIAFQKVSQILKHRIAMRYLLWNNSNNNYCRKIFYQDLWTRQQVYMCKKNRHQIHNARQRMQQESREYWVFSVTRILSRGYSTY